MVVESERFRSESVSSIETNLCQVRVMGYLQQFVGNMINEEVCRFLRFTTGSSVIVVKRISVDYLVGQLLTRVFHELPSYHEYSWHMHACDLTLCDASCTHDISHVYIFCLLTQTQTSEERVLHGLFWHKNANHCN